VVEYLWVLAAHSGWVLGLLRHPIDSERPYRFEYSGSSATSVRTVSRVGSHREPYCDADLGITGSYSVRSREYQNSKRESLPGGLGLTAGRRSQSPMPVRAWAMRYARQPKTKGDIPGFGLHPLRRANIIWRQENGGSAIAASKITGPTATSR